MDSILHFTISFWLVFCILVLYNAKLITKERLAQLLTLAFTLMIGKEMYDYFDYGLFSIKDMAFNLLGVLTAVFIASNTGK